MDMKKNKIFTADFFKRNEAILIFCFFFLFYFALGCCIACTTKAYEFKNIFFGADNARVYADLTLKYDIYNHYRIKVHPLFLIFFQPIFLFIKGIIQQPKLAVLALEALSGAGSAAFLYKILDKKLSDKHYALIFSFFYGFSFSAFIFSTIPESFAIAGFFLIAFWYFVLTVTQSDEKLNRRELFVLIFFGIACFGTTLTNYFFYGVGMLFILLKKNKKVSDFFEQFILINIANLAIIFLFTYIQKAVWGDVPIFFKSLLDLFLDNEQNKLFKLNEENTYIGLDFSLNKIYRFIKQFFVYPILSSIVNVDKETGFIFWSGSNPVIKLLAAFVIIIWSATVFLKLSKNIKSKRYADFFNFLLLAYVGNAALHIIYASGEAFIYSPHYFFIFVILFAIALKDLPERLQGAIKIISLIFVAFELINNLCQYWIMAGLLREYFKLTFSRFEYCVKGGFIACAFIITAFAIYMIIFKARQDGKTEKKYASAAKKTSLPIEKPKVGVTDLYVRAIGLYIVIALLGSVCIYFAP